MSEIMSADVVAIYGSPRKNGNTEKLLREAVKGLRMEGAAVSEFWLRDMRISPCLEIYGCKESGRCVINDDFHIISDAVEASKGIVLASPVFFYGVSGHTKAFIDRFQSWWVKKYWLNGNSPQGQARKRPGMFISVGATKGKRLFDGVLLTMRYFMDALDGYLWKSLLYRGLDGPEDVTRFPEYLQEAHQAGRAFFYELKSLNK